MQKNWVFPVIHEINEATSIGQADLAFEEGADGVFLISHHGRDIPLLTSAQIIKTRHPHKLIGVNLLNTRVDIGLQWALSAGVDMFWTDVPEVSSKGPQPMALQLKNQLEAHPRHNLKLYASIAFKYQAQDPFPGAAAEEVVKLGFVPTTSGSATGKAPDVSKLQGMRHAIGPQERLAIASGMTPENVTAYTDHVTDFLVATGVSDDAYHFNREKLASFIAKVKQP